MAARIPAPVPPQPPQPLAGVVVPVPVPASGGSGMPPSTSVSPGSTHEPLSHTRPGLHESGLPSAMSEHGSDTAGAVNVADTSPVESSTRTPVMDTPDSVPS